MIYCINICDKCGQMYRMESSDDRFCPFCGAEVKMSFANSDNLAYIKEIQAGKREIARLKNEMELAAIKRDSKLEAENKRLLVKNNELLSKIAEFEKAMPEKKPRSVQERLVTRGRSNPEIFLQFINMSDKKNNPLPPVFERRHLDLSGQYILDGSRGTATAVYLCKTDSVLAQIYPNEMIVSTLMRDYYTVLFDIENKFGKNMTSIDPAVVETSNTGYYKLVNKGSIVFE